MLWGVSHLGGFGFSIRHTFWRITRPKKSGVFSKLPSQLISEKKASLESRVRVGLSEGRRSWCHCPGALNPGAATIWGVGLMECVEKCSHKKTASLESLQGWPWAGVQEHGPGESFHYSLIRVAPHAQVVCTDSGVCTEHLPFFWKSGIWTHARKQVLPWAAPSENTSTKSPVDSSVHVLSELAAEGTSHTLCDSAGGTPGSFILASSRLHFMHLLSWTTLLCVLLPQWIIPMHRTLSQVLRVPASHQTWGGLGGADRWFQVHVTFGSQLNQTTTLSVRKHPTSRRSRFQQSKRKGHSWHAKGQARCVSVAETTSSRASPPKAAGVAAAACRVHGRRLRRSEGNKKWNKIRRGVTRHYQECTGGFEKETIGSPGKEAEMIWNKLTAWWEPWTECPCPPQIPVLRSNPCRDVFGGGDFGRWVGQEWRPSGMGSGTVWKSPRLSASLAVGPLDAASADAVISDSLPPAGQGVSVRCVWAGQTVVFVTASRTDPDSGSKNRARVTEEN